MERERASSDGRFIEVASGLVFNPLHRNRLSVVRLPGRRHHLVNNKLMLTAGSKVLRTNYTGVSFEPSVRLLWTPTDRQTFWASYTHALRTPSDAEEDFYLSSFIGDRAQRAALFCALQCQSKFRAGATERLRDSATGS